MGVYYMEGFGVS